MAAVTSARITVGIPTRNRSEYLLRAAHSALNQTYSNVEVVVSDNASTDDTSRRIEEISDGRLVYLKQANNIGMVANFNACLDAARGELFLMLSDDDVLEPEALDRLSAPFGQPPPGVAADSIGLSWCPCVILNAAGDALWTTEGGPEIEPSASFLISLFTGKRGPRFCSVMGRTADMRAVAGYDEERYGALCDTANWAQVALRHDAVVCINQPLAKYTVHTVSETSQARCSEWQAWGENMHADLVALLQKSGNISAEQQMRDANGRMLANLTVTVLIQMIGGPKWIEILCREAFRSRRYLLTPYVARRLFVDGWKIILLRKQSR